MSAFHPKRLKSLQRKNPRQRGPTGPFTGATVRDGVVGRVVEAAADQGADNTSLSGIHARRRP